MGTKALERRTRALYFRPEGWWTDPIWLVFLVVAPAVLLPYLIPRDAFVDFWDTDKVLGAPQFLAVAACLFAIVIGALIARLRPPGVARVTRFPLDRAPSLLVLISVAYLVWVVVGVMRGLRLDDVVSVLSGTSSFSVVKEPLAPIGGLSTITQLTPLATGMYVLRAKLGYTNNTRPLILLGVFAVTRAVVYAERLALLEFIVPAIVVAASVTTSVKISGQGHDGSGLIRRLAWRGAPLAAPFAMLGMFGALESTRSWAATYSAQGMPFGDFVVTRFSGYYATAANNSAILIEAVPRTGVPFYSIQWVWDFPGISNFLSYETVAGTRPDVGWLDLLGRVANPEYNSPGGILTVVWDFGVVVAALVFLGLGFWVSRCYQRVKSGDLASVVLLGILTLAILELPRFFYLGQGRAFPSVAGWLILVFLERKRIKV